MGTKNRTWLKQAREAAGYHTQKALADETGIPQTTLACYESGARFPNRSNMKLLVEKLKVRVEQFYEESAQ